MIDENGRLILDQGLSTGATGGSTTGTQTSYGTGGQSTNGYGGTNTYGGGYGYSGGYTSGNGDWFCYLIMFLLAVGACVFAYLAYGDLKAIDGGGLETALTTWGAIVMIPVVAILGLMFVDSLYTMALWTIIGVLMHGFCVFCGEPQYFTVNLYCLISAVCATILTLWVCAELE